MHGCFGIITAVTLIVGELELNPGQQMKEKINKLMEFMVEQRRDKRYASVVRKNKSKLGTVSVKVDIMNVTTKILKQKQNRFKGLVNSSDKKL
jgi:hypothetical protein